MCLCIWAANVASVASLFKALGLYGLLLSVHCMMRVSPRIMCPAGSGNRPERHPNLLVFVGKFQQAATLSDMVGVPVGVARCCHPYQVRRCSCCWRRQLPARHLVSIVCRQMECMTVCRQMECMSIRMHACVGVCTGVPLLLTGGGLLLMAPIPCHPCALRMALCPDASIPVIRPGPVGAVVVRDALCAGGMHAGDNSVLFWLPLDEATKHAPGDGALFKAKHSTLVA